MSESVTIYGRISIKYKQKTQKEIHVNMMLVFNLIINNK